MVKPATITKYAPAATCDPDSQLDNTSVPDYIGRRADWHPLNVPVAIGTELHVSPTARQIYGVGRNDALSHDCRYHNAPTAHQVSGLGDVAYIIYCVDPASASSHATLLTYWGNAEIEVTYDGTRVGPGGRGATPVDRQTAEAAVVAVARDVYASLS
jgi:hypothetical protein